MRIASYFVGFALDRLAGSFPKTIRIETTNGCNAKCTICPHREMERPVRNMDDGLFRKIIFECSDNNVETLHLHNFGEPLLDNKLPERIALCKSQGIGRVKIFSNASLLSEERSRELIDAGLDEIKISFDGANKEEFEAIRTPLKYMQVVENVKTLVRLRDALGAKDRLKIFVTCSSTTDKDRTMAALSSSVDGFSFGRIHNWANWNAAPEGATRLRSGMRKPCSRVWQTFTILADGRVALCCLDYDGKCILGDLTDSQQTIKTIWRSKSYLHFRHLHKKSCQDEISSCATCAKSFW